MPENRARYFFEGNVLSKEMTSVGERRLPCRPLGRLSDLVVEEMPQILNKVSSGSQDSLGALNQALEESASSLLVSGLPQAGTSEHAVSRLDSIMGYTALAHSGVKIGPGLSEVVRKLSQGQVPGLTYQDIILTNPFGVKDSNGLVITRDPRTFRHGEVGADEEHFYLIHQELEHGIKGSVESIKNTLVNIDIYGITQETVNVLSASASDLDILINNTRTVGAKMKPSRFDQFRKYLNPIPKEFTGPTLPNKDFPGPSGAYSGTVHALDLLLIGSQAKDGESDEMLNYVLKNRRLFPTDDHSLLDEATALAVAGKSLKDIAGSFDCPIAVLDLLEKLAKQLGIFRHVHKPAVGRQVPGALEDPNAMGTGGITQVGKFLDGRIERTQAVLEFVKQIKTDRGI